MQATGSGRKRNFNPFQARLRIQITDRSARDFFAGEAGTPQEYFVYFKAVQRTDAEKDPLRCG